MLPLCLLLFLELHKSPEGPWCKVSSTLSRSYFLLSLMSGSSGNRELPITCQRSCLPVALAFFSQSSCHAVSRWGRVSQAAGPEWEIRARPSAAGPIWGTFNKLLAGNSAWLGARATVERFVMKIHPINCLQPSQWCGVSAVLLRRRYFIHLKEFGKKISPLSLSQRHLRVRDPLKNPPRAHNPLQNTWSLLT